MNIKLNGQQEQIAGGMTIAGLLTAWQLDQRRLALEYNGTIIAQEQFAGITLQDDDCIEIISFVGGG